MEAEGWGNSYTTHLSDRLDSERERERGGGGKGGDQGQVKDGEKE